MDSLDELLKEYLEESMIESLKKFWRNCLYSSGKMECLPFPHFSDSCCTEPQYLPSIPETFEMLIGPDIYGWETLTTAMNEPEPQRDRDVNDGGSEKPSHTRGYPRWVGLELESWYGALRTGWRQWRRCKDSERNVFGTFRPICDEGKMINQKRVPLPSPVVLDSGP